MKDIIAVAAVVAIWAIMWVALTYTLGNAAGTPVLRDHKKIKYCAIEEMYSRLLDLEIHGTRSTITYE